MSELNLQIGFEVFKSKNMNLVPGIVVRIISIPRDHPFKTQHVLGGDGCPHGPMVKRSQYIRIKNLLHKHFAGMPMVGVKNRENLPPTSDTNGPLISSLYILCIIKYIYFYKVYH